MDLALGGFWPYGRRIRSSLSGDGPQGRGDLALRGFLAPRGGSGMHLAHGKNLALWGGFGPRSRRMALRGGPLSI